ncbi:MAG: DUF2339 domain-containing protein [Bacteroidota bacterium]
MVAFLSLFVMLLFAAFVVLVAVLFSRINRVEHEMRRLSESLPPKAPEPNARQTAARRKSASARRTAKPRPSLPLTPLPPTPLPPLPRQPRRPSRSKEEWESLIGGRLLNRIGAVALIIGMGFFLKYAFDKNWINETVRVLIGAAIGGGLLVAAARSHRRGFQIFSQGLVGAGISILYLSVYASFNFYHLVPQLVAFLLMTAVTIVAFANAFRYDTLAVALLGWLGGFLTPIMLSTGQPNELGLFTYIALLDLGILIVSLRKTAWTILEPLALCATWLLYVMWYSDHYITDAFALTLYFVAVFWLLFHVLSTGRVLKGESSFATIRLITASANALFSFIALYNLFEPELHEWNGLATALMGGVYALTAVRIGQRKPEARTWNVHSSVSAALLLIAATAIQFKQYTTVELWTVEALALAWLGSRWKLPAFHLLAAGLFVAAGMKLLGTSGALIPLRGEDVVLLFNERGLTYAVLAAAGWLGAGTIAGSGSRQLTMVARLLSIGAAVVVFILLTVEISAQYTRLLRAAAHEEEASLYFSLWMTLAVGWGVYGAILSWIGTGRKETHLYVAGLVVLFIAIVTAALRGIAFDPIVEFTPLANWRVSGMAAVAAAGFFMVRRLDGTLQEVPGQRAAFATLRMAIVVLLLALVTGETRDFFEKDIAAAPPDDVSLHERLENLEQLSLSGVWLFYSIIIMVVGFWRRSRALRIGSIVLFGITILKIFIYDLSFLETLYRIFSFIGLGIILLAVSYTYQRYKSLIFGTATDTPAPAPKKT